MENVIHCDYCDEEIKSEPAHTYDVHVYCCDPCYDAAMEATRSSDEIDRHFGFDVPFDR